MNIQFIHSKQGNEDLIKNVGIIGKVDYSFCKGIGGLNQVFASILNNIYASHTNGLNIISSLDKYNLYNANEIIRVIKKNKAYRFSYVTKEK